MMIGMLDKIAISITVINMALLFIIAFFYFQDNKRVNEFIIVSPLEHEAGVGSVISNIIEEETEIRIQDIRTDSKSNLNFNTGSSFSPNSSAIVNSLVDEKTLLTCDSDTKCLKLLPPKTGVYHGAFAEFSPYEDIVTDEMIVDFETLVGKEIVWGYFSNNWFKGIVYPKQQIETLHKNGVVPFVRLMPRSRFQVGGQDPVYTLQKIIDGDFDIELREWARQAKKSGIPLLVEFGTEVNGNWFTWSGVSNGGGVTSEFGDPNIPDGPERFQVAYRHIIDLFKEEQAYNITWFFHVNLISGPLEEWNQPQFYYPGDDYIDWIGVSVYGAQRDSDPWVSFTKLMDEHFDVIKNISPTKPVAILEFGTVQRSGEDKAGWIKDALESIKSERYQNIKAISYWHSKWINEDGFVSNMRLNSSQESLQAYREFIQDSFFVSTSTFSH